MRGADNGSWLGVWAIAFGAFAIVVTEFLPVGLLPSISRDLHISEGVAGLTITSTALFGFLAAPATAIGAGCLDRKLVLLGLAVLLIIATVISAFASSFFALLIARMILGLTVGGFWAVAVTGAAQIVPDDKISSASSLVFAGISVASVVAVPAGSYIGAHFDWRIAFIISGFLAVIAAAALVALVPSIPVASRSDPSQFLRLLQSKRVMSILLTILLIVAGQYAGFTFITPFLEQITRIDNNALNLVLLGYGLMSVLGNFLGGALAGRNLQFAILATITLFLVSVFAVAAFSTNVPMTCFSAMIWAIAWGMVPVCTQLWLFNYTRDAAEAAQAMNTSVFQLAISSGSLIGGLVVDHINLHSSMWSSVGIIALALMTAIAVGRMDHASRFAQSGMGMDTKASSKNGL